MSLSKTFLGKVKQRNKRLFLAFVTFICVQLLFALLLYQATPFYIFSMYGRPAPPQNEYPVYVLKVNGDTFNLPVFRDHQRMVYEYTILRYDEYLNNGKQDPFEPKMRKILNRFHFSDEFYHSLYNTPQEIDAYPIWLKKYMSKNLGKPVHTLTVDKVWVSFQPNGHLKINRVGPLIQEN